MSWAMGEAEKVEEIERFWYNWKRKLDRRSWVQYNNPGLCACLAAWVVMLFPGMGGAV